MSSLANLPNVRFHFNQIDLKSHLDTDLAEIMGKPKFEMDDFESITVVIQPVMLNYLRNQVSYLKSNIHQLPLDGEPPVHIEPYLKIDGCVEVELSYAPHKKKLMKNDMVLTSIYVSSNGVDVEFMDENKYGSPLQAVLLNLDLDKPVQVDDGHNIEIIH